MTRDERLRNRGAAERLLEKMNDMIRGQSYAKMVKEGRIDQLHCEIVRLGWMVLTKSLKLTKVDGKMEMLLIKTPETAADMQGILNAFQRGTFDHPFITFRHVSNARFISSEATAWTVDGEFGGSFTEAEIKVEQQAVSIMLGNS